MTFERRGGIWRFLAPEEAARTAAFTREYETIRRAEGRGRAEPDYYRRLPETDPGDPLAEMWRIRTAGYRCFERNVLDRASGRLRIADLGSGNGWLANRLARKGHAVDAVDLLDNDWDGLGAFRHYEVDFRPVQAAFDALPYREDLFDLTVFNAALHYSVDFETTLRHALESVKKGGAIVVIDTPVYREEKSGREMVAERKREFMARYGFPSDALPMENFLTFDRLAEITNNLGLTKQLFSPRYPLRRRMSPIMARLRGRRDPAAFPIIALKETVS